LAKTVQRRTEPLEDLAPEAVARVAHTLEGRTDRHGGHGEGAGLRGGITLVHILHALGGGHRATGVEVYLEVLDGFEGHAQLKVLGEIARCRGGHAVAHEQPVVAARLLDIAVAGESEREIESGREGIGRRAVGLAEHIADIGHETG